MVKNNGRNAHIPYRDVAFPRHKKIAVERNLTFYDASYVYAAETKNLKLITEDEELLNKCKNSLHLNEFLKTSA